VIKVDLCTFLGKRVVFCTNVLSVVSKDVFGSLKRVSLIVEG